MSQQINLYDPALERQRDLLTATNVALAAAGLLAILGAWGGWGHWTAASLDSDHLAQEATLGNLRAEATALDAQVKTLKPNAQLAEDLAQTRRVVEARKEELDNIRVGLGTESSPFSEYLRALARQGTGDPWLTGFTFQPSPGGGMAELRGRTFDPALLPDYIKRLNKESVFRGQTFSALQMKASDSAAPAPGTPAPTSASPVPAGAPAAPSFVDFVLVPAAKPAPIPEASP